MRLLRALFRQFSDEWDKTERLKMKRIAHHYAERRHMDGNVIQKTGEVIPKESA